MGRPASCDCDICPKCLRRIAARERYQSLSPEQRRAFVAARDPEKVRAADRARYYRNQAKRKAAMADWTERNRERSRQIKSEWAKRNRHKTRVQLQLRRAVARGFVVPEPCEVCGKKDVQAHHDDYSKPLDVRWLCTEHHGVEHRRYA